MSDTPGTPDPRAMVELAAITGAHGVAGDVRLKLLGEGLDALQQHNSFNNETLTLAKIRPDNKGGAIARFAEVKGRDEAEKLRGTVLAVPRASLPELEAGEYYHTDLIGLAVQTDLGDAIGYVTAIHNFGATDIIEIALEPQPTKGLKSIMVPMTRQAVIEWDQTRLVISQDFADQ